MDPNPGLVPAPDTQRNGFGAAYDFTIRWLLKSKAYDGWIVQHVTTKTCYDKAPPGVNKNPPVFEYWEAWEVYKGDVYISDGIRMREKDNVDKFSTGDPGPGTAGTVEIRGKPKFISEPDLKDGLDSWYVAPLNHPGHGLLVRDKRPAWWTDDGTLEHYLVIKWDNVDKKPADVDYKPKPNVIRGR
jgi:hypothetical protein